MKKLMVILAVLVTASLATTVSAQESKLKAFDPMKEVAKVRLLTTADGIRWFQASAWCQSNIGCWKYERVGIRWIEQNDAGGPALCYTERVLKFLKKGSCILVLFDPLRGETFSAMVEARYLDRRIFKVLPVPEQTPTPSPTATPTRPPKSGGTE